jgi:hypothetical protein
MLLELLCTLAKLTLYDDVFSYIEPNLKLISRMSTNTIVLSLTNTPARFEYFHPATNSRVVGVFTPTLKIILSLY